MAPTVDQASTFPNYYGHFVVIMELPAFLADFAIRIIYLYIPGILYVHCGAIDQSETIKLFLYQPGVVLLAMISVS